MELIEYCANVDSTKFFIFLFFSDITSEPVYDWEEYLEPKEEQKVLLEQLKELSYRNM